MTIISNRIIKTRLTHVQTLKYLSDSSAGNYAIMLLIIMLSYV